MSVRKEDVNGLPVADEALFEVEDGVLTVKDKSKLPAVFLIPSEIDSEAVTVIGENAFSKCNGITSIEIPNTLTEIECEAFCG